MIRAHRLIGAVLCVTAALAGCSRATGAPPTAPFSVQAQDVPTLVAREHPVLIAVRSALEKGSEPGFVAGAVSVDVDQWHNASDSQAAMDDLARWSQLIGGLGISAGTHVLVYDDGGLRFASRVRFLLAHFGVRDPQLIEGGWPALAALGSRGRLALTPGATVPHPVALSAHVTQQPIPVVGRSGVAAGYRRPGVVLVDVRTAGEFDGTDLVPPVVRGGHIPGAVNLPYGETMNPAQPGDLLGTAQLERLFTAHGIVPSKTIIVYCQDGAKSSLVASELVQLHYPHVSLYYLSYADWQSDPGLPVQG